MDEQNVRASLPPLSGSLEFLRLVWALDHALQATSKRMHLSLGVTGGQRLVIRLIGFLPGVSAAQLAEILHLDPSTLSGVLRRLEERGFVKRTPDPKDGRRAVLHLAAKGRRVNATMKGTVEEAAKRALARFPEQHLTAASDVLRALAEALEPNDKR